MSYTKATIRDLQRFQKVYPYTRRTPREHYLTDRAVMLESARIEFVATNQVLYTFSSKFLGQPSITVTAEGEDLNAFISSVAGTIGGKWTATVETSQLFTGIVSLQAEWIDCP